MFYSITGNVVFQDLNSVAVECGGVAFRLQCSANTLRDVDIKEKLTLYTYLNVKEDALDLYGFSTDYELEWFKNLIGVTGVGPKAALAILSEYNPERLVLFISAGDAKAISKAQGVGPKIAQRVILELKDKVKSAASSHSDELYDAAAVSDMEDTSDVSEAIAALTMLGYTKTEASVAVSKTDTSLSVQDIIRQALKILSKKV